METKKKPVNYINNVKFLEEFKLYKEKIQEATLNNKPMPKVSDYIAKCIIELTENVARMKWPSGQPKFLGYSFVDECKDDAIENCFQYIDNFNPEKSSNPFAYFTTIIYYAFVRRIAKEKKQLYIKYKMASNYGIFDAITSTEPGMESSPFESYDNLDTYIEEFEAKKAEKKKLTTKKKKGLEKFEETV